MIMKKYIFLIVTVVCLFACKDGDEVRQTTSPEASFSINKEEYTVGDIVYLTDESVKTEGEIVEYFWHFGFEGKGIGLLLKMRPFCIRKLEPMLLN